MTAHPFFENEKLDLAAFETLVSQTLSETDLRFADAVVKNVPIYDARALAPVLEDRTRRHALLAEWADVFGRTAGVLVLKAAADTGAIDAATEVYLGIIAEEKARAGGGADHFAAAGANDRIWNSAQKLCLAAPEVFARYFAAPAIQAVCEAWLGPGYQMTAQVNLVRPGGRAQAPHRDYHLGFQTEEVARAFPAHAHTLSAALTLQGALAHCDMPVESGTTQLLPFSQSFPEGYLAYRHDEFREVFAARKVQLPLEKGDAVFFNPALFHAAGDNDTANIERMANLLQVSSAFGRAMESLDRSAMVRALYRVLAELDLSPAERGAVIAAAAEGYSFPTNLDTDPPVGGLAPETQAALVARCLDAGDSFATFDAELARQDARRRA